MHHLFLSHSGSVRVKKLIFAVMQSTSSSHSLFAASSQPEIGIVRLLKVGNKSPKKFEGAYGEGGLNPAAMSLPWALSRNVFMGVAGKWQPGAKRLSHNSLKRKGQNA